jgi:hypothetical protein
LYWEQPSIKTLAAMNMQLSPSWEANSSSATHELKSSVFVDTMLCILLKVNQCLWETWSRAWWLLHVDFGLAYSSTLKMEVTCSYQTCVDFQ